MKVAELLDQIKSANGLKNDAALAEALEILPPQISKMRSGKLALGAVAIIRIHEVFDVPVRELLSIARAGSGELVAA